MLGYLSEVIEESHELWLGTAKGAHAVLLHKMEEGKLDWSDTHKIDSVRRAYAHKMQNQNSNVPNTKKNFAKTAQHPVKILPKGNMFTQS